MCFSVIFCVDSFLFSFIIFCLLFVCFHCLFIPYLSGSLFFFSVCFSVCFLFTLLPVCLVFSGLLGLLFISLFQSLCGGGGWVLFVRLFVSLIVSMIVWGFLCFVFFFWEGGFCLSIKLLSACWSIRLLAKLFVCLFAWSSIWRFVRQCFVCPFEGLFIFVFLLVCSSSTNMVHLHSVT